MCTCQMYIVRFMLAVFSPSIQAGGCGLGMHGHQKLIFLLKARDGLGVINKAIWGSIGPVDLLISPHNYCWLGQVGADRAANLL